MTIILNFNMACSENIKSFSINFGFLEPLKKVTVHDEYTDPVAVCHAMDVREHGMILCNFIENTKVLIIKQRGRIYAMGHICPHKGGDLSKGVLGDGRVRCPLHGACFNIETGDIEDFPGGDSVPSYKVQVNRFGQVMVSARLRDLQPYKHIRKMVKRDVKNLLTFILVGGGPSSAICAETLRHEGFTGQIIIICREPYLPYDRMNFTKSVFLKIEDVQLRSKKFYEDYGIEVLVHNEVVKANVDDKNITLADDTRLKYDKLFIATGSSPNLGKIKGSHLKNIFTVRDFDDWQRIKKIVNSDKTVVCLGTSFTVLEIAQTLKRFIHCKINVIGRSSVPMLTIFGYKIGERLLRLYKEKGINMIMNNKVTEIVGDSLGIVTHVLLKDGTKLDCDIFVMGVGIKYNTNFLIGSGLPTNADGSVEADVYLKSLCEDVYVGGDLAYAPVFANNNQRACIGHYQTAQYHGYIAGINMAGFRMVQLRSVPFYSTTLFGSPICCAGYGLYSDVVVEGDLENLMFTAYYINDHDVVVAVISCNVELIASEFAELISQGGLLHGRELQNQKKHWTYRLKSIVKCY